MERTEQENIAEQLTLRMFSAGGRLETKTIHPIEGELPEGLHSLGRSAGTDANVAIGMLYRHCPGFFERVTAYRLVSDPELSAATGSSDPAIEFFERGPQ